MEHHRELLKEIRDTISQGIVCIVAIMKTVSVNDERMPIDARFAYNMAINLIPLPLDGNDFNYIMSILVDQEILKKFKKDGYYAILDHDFAFGCVRDFIEDYADEVFKLEYVEIDYSEYIIHKRINVVGINNAN